MFAVLVQLGADINCRDSTGHTPLVHASYKGPANVINILLTNNAQVNIETLLGSSTGSTLNLQCVVCTEQHASTIMMDPCGQAVTCQMCSDHMEATVDNRCPLCRTQVQGRKRIYFNQ